MDIDDHDKHLLAMIDARRPSSSSSNRTSARTGGMIPKMKRKVTFSDPLTSSSTTTLATTSFHENGTSGSRPSVLSANHSDLMLGNDHQQEASNLELLDENKKKNTSTNSVGDHDHNHEDLSSTFIPTPRLSSSQQQQSSQEFNVSSFSRFSSGQAGSKYDFQSVEDLLKNDSLSSSTSTTTTTSAKTSSINPPLTREFTSAFLNPQHQQTR